MVVSESAATALRKSWKLDRRMAQAPNDRSKQGADKRQLILDSAIKVFADKGYHGTRISDIAREAKIAYGLVYHYFKNKEDILDAIFVERWGGFIEAVEAVARDGRPVAARLLSIAEIILSSYRERSEWVKVLVFEIQRSQRFADPARVKVVGQLFAVIAGILREGQEAGELRRDLDPDLACYIFIGGLDIVVTSRVLDLIPVKGDEGAYYGQVARTVVDLFLNGMLESSTPGGTGTDPRGTD
jgi:TetR/AcrR family fatty acid metabolism transcriptional regulator